MADMDSKSVSARLRAIQPAIRQMMATSGAVGLSYAVVHKGQVETQSYGWRDKGRTKPFDTQTCLPICSMTKGLVTSLIAELVDQEKLQWDSKIKDILPWFSPQTTPDVRDTLSLTDLLSMKSGGLGDYNIWTLFHNRLEFEPAASRRLINSLKSSAQQCGSFQYNNWNYEVAAHVIKQVSGGESWDSLLHRLVFDPLQLTRTNATGKGKLLDNVSDSFCILENGDPVCVPTTQLSGQTIMGSAGGVTSCIDDLVKLYAAILKACIHQTENGATSTQGSPFKHLTKTMGPHTIMPSTGLYDVSYGLGWWRTQLPNFCTFGPNKTFTGGPLPMLGRGFRSLLAIGQYGSMPGVETAGFMFPETESFVVVLTNSSAHCWFADWVSQLLIQTLFDFPEKHDYVHWVERTVKGESAYHGSICEQIEQQRDHEPFKGNLDNFAGEYHNSAETFKLSIQVKDGGLVVDSGGHRDEISTLPMQYYKDMTFSWIQPYDDLARRACNIDRPLSWYLISFEATEGVVDRLYWAHSNQDDEFIKLHTCS